jgi:site-specific recombinase XerD
MTRKIPEVMDQAEQLLLLAPLRGSKAPTKIRNLALLRLMLDSGLRASEALALRTGDLNMDSGQLIVRNGKGGKDRALWIGQATVKLVSKWLLIAPARKNNLIFTTLKGGKISRIYLWKMVNRLAKKAGLSKKIHPHTLRHCFASDLLRDSKNLRLVQKALGHSQITTTQIYTHIVDDELEEAMKCLRNP